MDKISQVAGWMSGHAAVIVLLLAEVIAALVLAGGFWRLRRAGKRKKELLRGEQLYQQIVSQAEGQFQMLVRRKDQYPVFITDNVREFTGVERERVLENFGVFEAVFGKKETLSLQERYRKWNGETCLTQEFFQEKEEKWLRLDVTRVLDDKYDLVTLTDVTAHRHQVRELEEQIVRTEQESESKTSFLYRMSHEIRTPMNGITGMITLARRGVDPGTETMSNLDKASELCQYLLSLINDILDMSRIEAGKTELACEVIDLNRLMDQIDTMFRKTIEAKGVAFYLEEEDMDVRYVLGDELRILQIIVNFLSNAVKFTSQGEIRVIFRQMYRTEEYVNLMIRVCDTGKGMDPEFVNRIFKPFEQENSDIQKKYGGTGLGMAITDQLVQLMDGEIVIDSLPGKGARINVYLKLEIPDASQILEAAYAQADDIPDRAAEESGYSLRGIRILLAEDNEINAEIAATILEENEGAQVDCAENGQKALDLFVSSEENTYDVILMDIHMPVMDGLEAVHRIRALNRADASEVVIIALSADAFVEDRRRAMDAGMNEHVAKPIDFDALRTMIGKFLYEREQRRQEDKN